MLKKRKLLALLLALAMVLSLAACGKGEGDGSTSAEPDSSQAEPEEIPEEEPQEEVKPFTLGYYAGVGINPYTCDNAQNQTIVGLVYEPLFSIDEHFQATTCLAKSISVERSASPVTVSDENGKSKKTNTVTVSIKLQEGIQFSDGSSLDASDVTYSLNLAKAEGSVYASRLSKLSSVTGSGSRVTLVFHSGNTSVAALLDIPIVKEGTGGDKVPVGTGPYQVKLKDGKPNKLVKNPNWWQEGMTYTITAEQDTGKETAGDASAVELNTTKGTISYPLDEIGLSTAEDSDELIFGFSSGDVSMVSTDITGTGSLSFTGSYQVFDYDTTDLLYLGFNTEEGPCKEQKLRQAIYQAVDRETIARKSLSSHAVAAYMPVAPSSNLYDNELAKKLAYDLSQAKELCGDVRPGSELTLIVNSDSTFKDGLAREIETELEAAGLAVRVETLDWSSFKDALKDGDYDLYLGEVKMSGNFDLYSFLNKSGSLNYSGYKSSELTSLLNKLYAATGDSRPAAASALYEQLVDEAPFAPLCFKKYSVFAQKGYMEKIYPTQSNLFNQFYRWQFSDSLLEASR